MRQPFCFHGAERGAQVGKESVCRMDRSKQRDANSRFGSGQLTWPPPKHLSHPQREDILLSNASRPTLDYKHLEQQGRKMQKKEKINKETFAALSW